MTELVNRVKVYLYVTPFFPTPEVHFGSYGYDFVKALTRQLELRAGVGEWRVELFKPGDGSDYEVGGITVRTFKTWQLPSAILPLLFRRYNERSFIDKVKAAGKTEGWGMGDIAICHGNTASCVIYPLAVKRLNSKCKTLLHHHDLASVGLRMGVLRHFWLHKVINFLMLRKCFEAIDCHVYISNACKRNFEQFPNTEDCVYADYRKLGRGLNWLRSTQVKDSYILWNGVDKSVFNEVESCKLKVEGDGEKVEGEFVIGCVGNFIEVKNHIGLARAVNKLVGKIPGLRVELLGTNGLGHYREDVERYIKDNKLEGVIKILPHLKHSEMASAYRRWDLFVLPCYFEGFGCVFTEAWSCGTPFIGCEGQGIEDIIKHEDRHLWLAKPKDDDDLADKILAYYENRPKQVLSGAVDFDTLMSKFLKKVEEIMP